MFRLLTFFGSILGFAAIVWFGVTVDLGDRTLFGHLRAIGASEEAQQLWDGTKGKVTDFVGIEAAKRAEQAKAAARAAAEEAMNGEGEGTEKPKAKGAGTKTSSPPPAVERAEPSDGKLMADARKRDSAVKPGLPRPARPSERAPADRRPGTPETKPR